MIDMGESTNLSAETAATELARFANITGMSQDKFSNLGSAIVDLGNNFATTESEISAMALRLAGAGKQVGMSEGDILGFAAALSSVGVEAEAGGSAFSKVMIQMQLAVEKGTGAFTELEETANAAGYSIGDVGNAVSKGGNTLKGMAEALGTNSSSLKKWYKEADKSKSSLENFANVAGVTSEEFSNMFKSNPTEAIMSFVEGLSHADEKGTSAIKMLDDMDIKEVRLRDSLLRAANASDIFGDAVEKGNTAFGESTALAEEAGKRYETVESQLGMLKNEVVDVAIEFGGPFLQALRDGLQTAKPFIKTIGDLAKKFSEANPETQKSIMKYLALAAAIGPASKVLGGFLKITGGGISTVGKFSQWIGKLSGTAKASKSALEIAEDGTVKVVNAMSMGAKPIGLFGKVIAGAKTSVFGFSGVLGALTSPLGIAVGAIAAGTAIWKIWGEDAYNSAERTRRWGTDVGEATNETLNTVKNFANESELAMSGFENGVTGSAEAVEEAFNNLSKTIEDTSKDVSGTLQETIDKLPEKMQAGAKENAEKIEEQNQKVVESSKRMASQVGEIYKRHNNDVSELTDAEKEIVLSNRQSMIQAELNLLELSGKDKQNIMSVMNNDIATMNQTQLGEYVGSIGVALDRQAKSYEEQVNNIKESRKLGLTNEIEYYDEMERLQSTNVAMTQELGEKFVKAYSLMGKDTATIRVALREFGLDYDEVMKNSISATSEAAEANSIFAKSVEDMSQDTIIANEKWNDMVFDTKTGEIKTNVGQVIAEAASGEEGWQNLEFILKNAILNTNARAEVAIAMGEADKWNGLNMDQKLLIADGDLAQVEFFDSIDSAKQWNDYKAVVKEIGADNKDALSKIFSSKETLQGWINMDPRIKDILVNNRDKSKIMESTELLSAFDRLPDPLKNITINANTYGATQAQNAINSVTDREVWITINARDNAQQTLINRGVYAMRATGDPYFQGGPVILGDGGKAEPYLTPDGNFGVSPASDTMHYLPRGTKIWPSIQKMMDSLPRYATGTKFDDTAISRFSFKGNSIDYSSILFKILDAVKELSIDNTEKLARIINGRPVEVKAILDGEEIQKNIDDSAGRLLSRRLYTS